MSSILASLLQDKKFIYYSYYSYYSMNSTIQLSTETKQLIGTFGSKEDTYEEIILRMYDLATKEQLREFLLSSEDTISLAEARKELDKLWPRSK